MGAPKLNWKNYERELKIFTDRIYTKAFSSRDEFNNELYTIFGNGGKIQGTDTRVIALIEYCFYKAEGPYSPSFEKYLEIILSILENHPPMKRMLDRTADHALGNMVLKARGKLKFEICDRYELIKVLKAWTYIGLKRTSSRAVFQAILEKPSVQQRLQRRDLYLLARLTSIFPQWRKEIMPSRHNIAQELFQIHRSRFTKLVDDTIAEGTTLEKLIEQENNRVMPLGIKRNTYLSYLIKRKHNFQCQICTSSPIHASPNRPESKFMEAHHILPVSQGGEDHSSNILCLCSYHHTQAHTNRLSINLEGWPPIVMIHSHKGPIRLRPN